MAGLGIGGWRLGQRAEHTLRPLAYYAKLELGVCLFAAISPWTLPLLGKAYLALGGEPRLGLWGATLGRLLVAVLVMGPAAFLMGGTLPAAARAAETDHDTHRTTLALLYSLNTAGAVLGSLLGTFALFELLGTRASLWFACLLNLLVAVVAQAWARELPDVPLSVKDEQAEGVSPTESRPLRWERRAVYLAAAVVGFAFIGSELIWYRVMGPILGGSTYSFGLILAIALTGIGLGGWWYSQQAKSQATWTLLSVTVLGEALVLGLPIWIGDPLAIFAAQLRNLAALGFGALVLTWVIVCLVVVLPAAVISGYQFPVLIALLGRGRSDVANHVGRAYLFNTAGSVLGSLLVGFILLPRLGAISTWRGLTGALVLVGLLAILRSWKRQEALSVPSLVFVLLLATGSGCSMAATGPTSVWRHTPIGAGRATNLSSDANQLKAWTNAQRSQILWERDGVDVTVALAVDSSANFIVSGKSDGSVQGDRGTQAMCALMAALLHPDPKQGFVLGLGTGMSAGWLAKAISHVDVAELEPAIVEVARSVGAANGNVLAAPNVTLFLGDGREFLLTTRKHYDVIMSEPSNPYRAGVASLFTADFYRTVQRRLAPRGIFVQWLQGYEVDTSVVLMTLRSLREVFPFVEIWQSQGADIALLSSMEPREYDLQLIRDRASKAPYLDVMRRTWLAEGAEALFSHAYGNAKFVDTLLDHNQPQVNTDDENLVEFAAARSVGKKTPSAAIDLFYLALASKATNMNLRNGQLDNEQVHTLRSRGFLISGDSTPFDAWHQNNARSALFQAGCTGNGQSPLTATSDFPPARDLVEVYAYGRVLALKGSEQSPDMAEKLVSAGFDAEASYLRGLYFQSKQQPETALYHYEQAILSLRREALPLCELGSQLVHSSTRLAGSHSAWTARIARALMERPFVAYLVENHRIAAAQELAFLANDPKLCVQALGKQLQMPTWSLPFLNARLDCLEREHHPMASAARRDVLEYLGNSSGNYGMVPPKLLPMPSVAIESP